MLSARIQYVLKAFLPWLLAGIAAILGAVLTYNAWQKSEALHYKNVNAQFQEATNIVAKNIQNRFKTYTVIMRGVQGLYKASDDITRAEFKAYVDSLLIEEKLPGVQGIGYAVVVLDQDLPSHVANIRSHGVVNYNIHPAGKRPFYVPILRMEPERDNNERVLGLDAYTLPIAREAMLTALKTNGVSITSRLVLHQDRDKPNTYGFVMYLPIIKAGINPKTAFTDFKGDDEAFLLQQLPNIEGWVDVPFRMNELIGGLAGEFDQGITLKIYDGTSKSADSLMYDSNIDQEGLGKYLVTGEHTVIDPRLSANRILNIGGRDWLLEVAGLKSFHAVGLTESQPLLLAMTGATLTTLLALLTFLLASRFRQVEAQFSELFNKASDGILILNKSHRFINANPAALKKLGYSSNALIGLSFADILSAHNPQHLASATLLDSATLLAQSTLNEPLELIHLTKSGETFIAEVSINKLSNQHYFATFRDLTERIKAQQRIARLSKLYQALSETNQAIVRMHDENALFPLVVKSAVEFGGMKLAWIGQARENLIPQDDIAPIDDMDAVLSVAAYGEGLSYLDSLNISINPDIPEGLGPTGTALRANTCVIVNDYLNDANTAPWHQEAMKYGWASAASFPIQRNGKIYAALNLYSDVINAFDNEAVSLFKEMATDISFALDNFDREHQRKIFEQHLIDNEAKLQLNAQVFEASIEGILITDHNFNIQSANSSYLMMQAVNNEAIVGHALQATLFSDQTAEFYAAVTSVIHSISRWQGEVNGTREDGTDYTQWVSISAIKDAQHHISHYVVIVNDISRYKEAQAKISYLSYFNNLTGLPNRQLLKERTSAAMAACQKIAPLLYWC